MPTKFNYTLHVFRSPRFQNIIGDAIKFFTQTPEHILPPPSSFIGGGVYALYYSGDYELYAKFSGLNRQSRVYPIYVGKAVPPGWRTGRVRSSKTPDLHRRLKEHTNSILQATNLQTDDFKCRFMILNEIETDLVVPIEAELIRRYKPLWNMVVDGFGNHDPGSGRYNQARSEWDVLHPGRRWAARLTGTSPALEGVIRKVQQHLENLSLS